MNRRSFFAAPFALLFTPKPVEKHETIQPFIEHHILKKDHMNALVDRVTLLSKKILGD